MLIKDIETWNRVICQRDGYIYNDFRTQFPGNSPTWNTSDFNKLHRASCPQIKKMTHITEGKPTKYFFETRDEVLSWLEKNRKEQGYTFCTYCKP